MCQGLNSHYFPYSPGYIHPPYFVGVLDITYSKDSRHFSGGMSLSHPQILGSVTIERFTRLHVDSRMKFEEVDEALKQCTVREAQREPATDPSCEMVPLKGVEGDAFFF